MRPIPSLDEIAQRGFGDPAELVTSKSTVLELAAYYADKAGLAEHFPSDPDITTSAIVLATARMGQARLLFEIERDLYEMMEEQGLDYGKALFSVSRGGRHKEVWAEIDRQERRIAAYWKRLEGLAQSLVGGAGSTS